MMRLLGPAVGALRAWRTLRLIWLSGALDSGRIPDCEHRPMIVGGAITRDLGAPDASEVLYRTWPNLLAEFRRRTNQI